MNINTLSTTGLSLALSKISQEHDGLICIVTPTLLSAQRLQDEINFFQLQKNIPLMFLPDWETLPYDRFSPHQDIISERLATLSKLKALKKGILIAALPTLLHKLPPYHFIAAHSLNLSVKQQLDIETFRQHLQQAGYIFVTKVMEHGECAIRGSIIDIYPMGSRKPFRIDLFDNEIDTIRLFDVDSQRSSDQVKKIALLPAREFPLDEKGIAHFRSAFRHRFEGNPANRPVYNSVSEGMAPAGIEYYLPLFFEQTATLFDYLSTSTQFFLVNEKESLQQAGENFQKEVYDRYEQHKHDITHPLLSPDELFLTLDTFHTHLKAFTHKEIPYNPPSFPVDITAQKNIQHSFDKLKNYLATTPSRVLICSQTAGRRELLSEQLTAAKISFKAFAHWPDFINSSTKIGLIFGPLETGFVLDDLAVITEAELWGETLIRQRKTAHRSLDIDTIVRDLSELHIGSAVVHIEHGVGRYLGLQNIEHDNQINEFLVLEYAGNDKIYVPVTSLEKISRYTGLDPDTAPLHRLGSGQWQKEKKKAQEKIHDTAVELLEIYAKREARQGFSCAEPDSEYQTFAAAFPFEETPDQTRAIQQVIKDMESKRPMDRLICGDVGFGKTEVAMRACFLAVQNRKQVCVLVPTTLLAGQHYENFTDRFAEFGVNIELLSRFRTGEAAKKVKQGLTTGLVDIVIGTHTLLSKNIQFKNLGLLVIDEEHRFGVKQKEHIKSLRHEVDILSLTATPIPRTLNMSLSGLRDISVIATPPLKRLAIKTFVQEKNPSLIREAILREIMRGGQVFYLFNKVASIENTAAELRTLLAAASIPETAIQVAHGQMSERHLEKVMSDFYHRRFQILVCSTIIETGIDIPTANTIIIEHADRFGLAQLHQLRGRVGRSHHQAYAYLLTPPQEAMTSDAVKRLDAILSIDDLGAGFSLATHDLEIRGAGELLGEDQSGNMHAIGFSLYMELLNTAVEALKSGQIPDLDKNPRSGPEISFHLSLIIPESYIADVHTRLVLYKRIAHTETVKQLDNLQVEMIDRFGLLPVTVKNLFRITELKFAAQVLGIKKISTNANSAKIEFEECPNVKPETLIKLIQVQPKTYQLAGPSQLKYNFPVENDVIDELFKLLKVLE
jgi:transcription-repair coupling factor (superfamily II helicase)